jgi:hypothetical protein
MKPFPLQKNIQSVVSDMKRDGEKMGIKVRLG